mmetsp:Transcript_32183/g.102588  ORF Transcript_32183/g.102588 Transcript_32183/m.102588 type:complete len:485 (-) Transcript_32183:317-1771(-)
MAGALAGSSCSSSLRSFFTSDAHDRDAGRGGSEDGADAADADADAAAAAVESADTAEAAAETAEATVAAATPGELVAGLGAPLPAGLSSAGGAEGPQLGESAGQSGGTVSDRRPRAAGAGGAAAAAAAEAAAGSGGRAMPTRGPGGMVASAHMAKACCAGPAPGHAAVVSEGVPVPVADDAEDEPASDLLSHSLALAGEPSTAPPAGRPSASCSGDDAGCDALARTARAPRAAGSAAAARRGAAATRPASLDGAACESSGSDALFLAFRLTLVTTSHSSSAAAPEPLADSPSGSAPFAGGAGAPALLRPAGAGFEPSSPSGAGAAEVRASTLGVPTDSCSSTLDAGGTSGSAVAAVSSPSLCAVSSRARAGASTSPLRFLALATFFFLDAASCCCPRAGSPLSFCFSSSARSSLAAWSAFSRASRSFSYSSIRRFSSSWLTPTGGKLAWLPLPGFPLRGAAPAEGALLAAVAPTEAACSVAWYP